MPEGWIETTLGEAGELVMGQSPPGSSYNSAGEGLPFIQGSAEFGDRFPTPLKWCTDPRKVAGPGDLLVSVRAPVGDMNFARERLAIGRGLAIVRGTERALAKYVSLALEQRSEALFARSGGGMFASITKSGLGSLSIPLPPIGAQRRIVDLIAAVEDALYKARAVSERASCSLSLLLDGLEAEASRLLGDLASLGSGPSWKAAQQTNEPVEGAVSVIGITNTPADGLLDMTQRRYVAGLPATISRLTSSSLVMIRTNGNRDRIGNVYRVNDEAVGCAFSAFQIGIHPFDSTDSRFLYWYLRSPSIQARISAAASGTTGLGNVAVRWLRELEILWPPVQEREAFVEMAEAVDAVAQAASVEAGAIQSMRTRLVADLLSGDREIPESYDAFLEQVS